MLVVSDHGAKRIDGGICVNEWLRQEGYLTLREEPAEPTRLTPDMIDWSRTTAWGEGGYYCRLFLNVAGREPEGTVAQEDYERVRGEIKEKLEALGDENGRPIGTVAHRPEELYEERNGIVPDLMVYFGDLYWRSIGQVGTGTVHVFENDTGPDDANHAHEGLYMLVADGVEAGRGEERALRRHRADAPRRCSASRCRRRWRGRASFEGAPALSRYEADSLRAPERGPAQPDQLPDHGAGARVRGRDVRAREARRHRLRLQALAWTRSRRTSTSTSGSTTSTASGGLGRWT